VVTGVLRIPVRFPDDPTASGATIAKTGSLPFFVAGPENGLAAVPYQTLLVDRSCASSGQNPITFFGAGGVGKSHLAVGLAAAWSLANPSLPQLITSGADWARSYASAYRENRLNAWRESHRKLGMLVIDDTVGLQKKSTAQRELTALIDWLIASRAPCLFTCRTNPNTAHELIPQVASRLSGGLSIPLAPPGPAARAEIICRLASQYDCRVAPDAVNYLTQHGPAAYLDIRSTVIQCSLLTKESPVNIINVDVVRQVTVRTEKLERIPLHRISGAVARYYQLPNAQLTGPTRRKAVSLARGIGILLSRQLTDATLKEIGRHYGNRDHTTVLHACRKVGRLSRTDADVQTALDELKRYLQSRYRHAT
jgi:chromosomal replication initiator protein